MLAFHDFLPAKHTTTAMMACDKEEKESTWYFPQEPPQARSCALYPIAKGYQSKRNLLEAQRHYIYISKPRGSEQLKNWPNFKRALLSYIYRILVEGNLLCSLGLGSFLRVPIERFAQRER